jgi:hypothetical protein
MEGIHIPERCMVLYPTTTYSRKVPQEKILPLDQATQLPSPTEPTQQASLEMILCPQECIKLQRPLLPMAQFCTLHTTQTAM